MTAVYTFIILSLCLIVFAKTRWIWALNQARKKGIFPEKGKATMFDVRRLIIEGEMELATEVYCWLFKTNKRKARTAIIELADSISEKNYEHD